MSELTKQDLLRHLRDALNHLRDPIFLRQSPLAALFGVADRPDTPAVMRRVLVGAIKSLRPDDSEPPQSPAWRLYESLFYRYVQYFGQVEIAHQLGISPRQLRREQHTALEALTHRLWEQYDVENMSGEPQATTRGPDGAMLYEDLAWLKDTPPDTATDLDSELPTVLNLARPLADRYRVDLSNSRGDPLPQLATHPVAFRQTLLTLLGLAISRAHGSRLHVSTRVRPGEVELEIHCTTPSALAQPIESEDDASLDMAYRLADLCHATLTVSQTDQAFNAKLSLPALGQVPVLVIDDNAGTLGLLQRYVAGTRYRCTGTRDAEQALGLAEQVSPQIIVLDVMMPHIDGWEVMGRLRQHPLTNQIPIVICTILPEEELAFSLGASDFVRKPVTRQAFLAALDRQVAWKATGSH